VPFIPCNFKNCMFFPHINSWSLFYFSKLAVEIWKLSKMVISSLQTDFKWLELPSTDNPAILIVEMTVTTMKAAIIYFGYCNNGNSSLFSFVKPYYHNVFLFSYCLKISISFSTFSVLHLKMWHYLHIMWNWVTLLAIHSSET